MGHPKGVADILPLTSAQRGMLYHSVGDAASSGQYVAVVSCELKGDLDPSRLKNALQGLIEARDAFKAGFIWEGVKQPLQIVRENVTIPWTQLDWSGLNDHESRLNELLVLEQARRFDLKKPPLMAVTVIKMSEASWYLVWTMHHLISDGWSTGIAFRDLLNRYHGVTPLNPTPPSFRSYLTWLRSKGELTNTEFWTKEFEGLESPSLLPEGNTKAPPTRQHSLERCFGNNLMGRIENLSTQLKITPNTVLSGAWALLLRQILQQNDVVFGTTTAGRPPEIPGISDAIGAFVNTLPVRCRIDPSQSASEFLRTFSIADIARRKHEFASLSEVQNCAPLAQGTQLFDTLFVNESTARTNFGTNEIEITNLRTTQYGNYPLTMLVTPQSQLKAELQFDPERVSHDTANDVLNRYEQLLTAIVDEANTPIKNLMHRFHPAPEISTAPQSVDVLDRFLNHAENNPNAVAISDGVQTLTYAELSLHARQIAHALQSAGVQSSDVVPIALPRGADAVAAFWGVMMCGVAYVPIDMDYPPKRITQMFEATNPRFIITCQELGNTLPDTAAQHILIDALSDTINPSDARTGERAYVMFTSGSQNLPKGVEVSRTGLALSTAARDTVYGAAPDVYLLLSSLAFDSSVAGIFWTLCTGGHLVIAEKNAEQHPTRLGALIAQHGVTHTLCLPGLAQALLTAVPSSDLASLRTLITAGEALHPSLVSQCRASLPFCQLFNEYGPTEATVWCTVFDATKSRHETQIPIGSAIPGTWVGVVDQDDCPVKPGAQGEIIVAGNTVAFGYLDDAKQSEKSFFRFGPDKVPAYRTGDLGVTDEAGCITFLGRADKQVKIRGHRVELSEIETAASDVAGGTKVAALVIDRSPAKSIVLAVENPPSDALRSDINRHIRATLPTHFHPSAVIAVNAFPTLPNGKMDLPALTEMVSDRPANQMSEAPRNELEHAVAALFAEVLNISPPNRDENFFDLGGDSLTTIATYAKGQDHNLEFEPTDLFSCPTVAELAARIVERRTEFSEFDNNCAYQISNPGPNKTTVVISHCSMRFSRYMAKHLGPDHSVVLIPSHRTEGLRVPYGKSFSELADEAILRLAETKNTGPFLFCGYSAGCPMVMEMAEKLGPQKVKGMVLLDPPYKTVGAQPKLQPLYFRTYKRWRYLFKGWKRKRQAKRVLPPLKAALAANPGSERHRIRAVEIVHGLAISDFRVPVFTPPAHVFLTPGNLSMTKGDVLETHMRNTTLHDLNMKHVELMRRPDVFENIARVIKSLSQGKQ